MFHQVQCDDMQNTQPLPPSMVATTGSSPISILDRVIAIAPAPLLPGEEEADYATIAGRIVCASGPRDAIEEFLIRDVVDLTWEILRLRRAKAGILKSSMGAGVRDILGRSAVNSPSTVTIRPKASAASVCKTKMKAIAASAAPLGVPWPCRARIRTPRLNPAT